MIKKIKSDIHATELLKGSFIALFFKVLGIFMQFLFFWILAKHFDAKGVGVFSLLWTILHVISVFSKLGFDTSIVKLIATYLSTGKDRLVPKLYLRVVFWIIVAGGAFTLIISLSANWIRLLFFEDEYYKDYILITCMAIIPLSILQINSEVFKSSKNITLYSIFQNGSIFFLSLIVILIAFPFYNQEKLIIISVFISILVLLAISLIFIQKQLVFPIKKLKGKILALNFKIESSRKLFKLSLPMLLSNSLFLILNWTDIIMLGIFKNEGDVGIYNVALKIAVMNTIILVGVSSVAMPKYAELYAQKEMKKLERFVKQTTLFTCVLSFPIFLFIILFPEFLLGLFGDGQEFLIGTKALLILTCGHAFSAFSSSSISLLNMTGKELSVRNLLMASVFVNIIFNYLLIPKYGINGAAITTTGSTVLWNILAVIVLYKNFKFTTYPINTGLLKKK